MQMLQVEAEIRLDLLLAQTWPALGRQAVRALIQGGAATVNGAPARKAGQYVAPGDVVEVHGVENFASVDSLVPDSSAVSVFSVEVLYEDVDLLVVDKPAGMALDSDRRAPGETLAQYLAARYPEQAHVGGVGRAGIVSQLEREASGLVLVARSADVYRALKHQVQRQRVESRYSVLVEGVVSGEDTIEAPIGSAKRMQARLAVGREGRPARTFYRALRHYKSGERAYTLLDVQPESGRLHQIRVHLAWYGFPVVGDVEYGQLLFSGGRRRVRAELGFMRDRLFIHLGRLVFAHPVTGAQVRVESRLPADLYSILQFMARPK